MSSEIIQPVLDAIAEILDAGILVDPHQAWIAGDHVPDQSIDFTTIQHWSVVVSAEIGCFVRDLVPLAIGGHCLLCGQRQVVHRSKQHKVKTLLTTRSDGHRNLGDLNRVLGDLHQVGLRQLQKLQEVVDV